MQLRPALSGADKFCSKRAVKTISKRKRILLFFPVARSTSRPERAARLLRFLLARGRKCCRKTVREQTRDLEIPRSAKCPSLRHLRSAASAIRRAQRASPHIVAKGFIPASRWRAQSNDNETPGSASFQDPTGFVHQRRSASSFFPSSQPGRH